MKYLLSLLALSSLILAGCRHIPTPPVEDQVIVPQTGEVVDEAELTGVIYYSSGAELMVITMPVVNSLLTWTIIIEGEAPGGRFFEATAPVSLTNWDGLIIEEGYITATEDRMTGWMIPFEGTLTYTVDPNRANDNGALILHKSNPSGLPENDAAVEIPLHLG